MDIVAFLSTLIFPVISIRITCPNGVPNVWGVILYIRKQTQTQTTGKKFCAFSNQLF